MTKEFESVRINAGVYELKMWHPTTVRVVKVRKNEGDFWFVATNIRESWYINKKYPLKTKHEAALLAQETLKVLIERQASSGIPQVPPAPQFPMADGRPMSREFAMNVLGLSPNATIEDAKTKHRQLAMAIHPDKGGSPFIMQQINMALARIKQG